MVAVPRNLVARVPDQVDDEAAAFTVLGAIALQGIRLVQPTLGEAVVVTGLGLIGLLTVQLLRAHGCRVLGIDFDPAKLALAERFGAETVDLGAGDDPVAAAERFSRGRGVDAVIITASTKSSEPVHQAALMCRKRGRIVLVGVTGLELSRADFYEKELTFQVSCSYGPGRYDPDYEERRPRLSRSASCAGPSSATSRRCWTCWPSGRLDVKPLISHRFGLDEAEQAYEVVGRIGALARHPAGISGGGGQAEESMLRNRTVRIAAARQRRGPRQRGARLHRLRQLCRRRPRSRPSSGTGARLKTVASSGGVSGSACRPEVRL